MKTASPLERLLLAKEKLPTSVREGVLAMGAEAVAPLVAILADDTHCDVDAPGEGWAPVHAASLLVDLKAEAAIDPLLQLVRDTEPDAIVHDTIVHRLPELGALVLEPALRHFAEEGDGDARQSLAAVLAALGVKDARIFDALVLANADDAELGAINFGAYGDPRGLPYLRQRLLDLAPDYASEQWAESYQALLHDYGALGGVPDEELSAHVQSIQAGADAHEAAKAQSPAHAPKVGRNDPCPCGSGKKFKKCCIDKATAPTT